MYTIDDDWVFGNEITEIIHFFFLRMELKELFIYFILYYFKLFLI